MTIGFHWDLDDSKAVDFAKNFYTELLETDLQVCTAMCRTRRKLYEKHEAGDPIWASPVLVAQPMDWIRRRGRAPADLAQPTSSAIRSAAKEDGHFERRTGSRVTMVRDHPGALAPRRPCRADPNKASSFRGRPRARRGRADLAQSGRATIKPLLLYDAGERVAVNCICEPSEFLFCFG